MIRRIKRKSTKKLKIKLTRMPKQIRIKMKSISKNLKLKGSQKRAIQKSRLKNMKRRCKTVNHRRLSLNMKSRPN